MALLYGGSEEAALEQAVLHTESQSARALDADTSGIPLNEFYAIAETAQWIQPYNRIALQFPDDLLADARKVHSLLLDAKDSAVIRVLGDTAYGACCVDEVAASHASADALVHFGRSCLSTTAKLPVKLVFGRRLLSMSALTTTLAADPSLDGKQAVLFYETGFDWALGRSAAPLGTDWPKHVTVAQIRQAGPRDVSLCGRAFVLPDGVLGDGAGTWRSRCDPDLFVPLWLGPADSPTAKAIAVALQRHTLRVVRVEQPSTPLAFNTMRFLMRRYTMVERCRTASAIALLCGTLAASRYAELLVYLRTLIAGSGGDTRCYTIVVGKPNEAKLANLGAVDAYCLIACRESTLAACDKQSFGAPIVTPLELQIAFDSRCAWDADYSTDFEEVLRRKEALSGVAPDETDTVVHMSLNTGRIVERRAVPDDTPSSARDVAKLTGGALVESFHSSAVVQHLQKSSFQGLDARLGQDAPSPLEQGRSGIASGYANEP